MIDARLLAAACMLAALMTLAEAAPRHDPALEEAAIKLAVSRLGPLRDGFDLREKPEFLRPAATTATEGDDAVWQDGLAPAKDKPGGIATRP
jgi:hypothetical protein